MKKISRCNKIFAIITCAAAVFAATIFLSEPKMTVISPLNSSFSSSAEPEGSGRAPMFLMKTYGDIIGIYHYGDENPFKLLNITVASLPEKDITALNEGIKLYSKEELYSLIEDFDG